MTTSHLPDDPLVPHGTTSLATTRTTSILFHPLLIFFSFPILCLTLLSVPMPKKLERITTNLVNRIFFADIKIGPFRVGLLWIFFGLSVLIFASSAYSLHSGFTGQVRYLPGDTIAVWYRKAMEYRVERNFWLALFNAFLWLLIWEVHCLKRQNISLKDRVVDLESIVDKNKEGGDAAAGERSVEKGKKRRIESDEEEEEESSLLAHVTEKKEKENNKENERSINKGRLDKRKMIEKESSFIRRGIDKLEQPTPLPPIPETEKRSFLLALADALLSFLIVFVIVVAIVAAIILPAIGGLSSEYIPNFFMKDQRVLEDASTTG